MIIKRQKEFDEPPAGVSYWNAQLDTKPIDEFVKTLIAEPSENKRIQMMRDFKKTNPRFDTDILGSSLQRLGVSSRDSKTAAGLKTLYDNNFDSPVVDAPKAKANSTSNSNSTPITIGNINGKTVKPNYSIAQNNNRSLYQLPSNPNSNRPIIQQSRGIIIPADGSKIYPRISSKRSDGIDRSKLIGGINISSFDKYKDLSSTKLNTPQPLISLKPTKTQRISTGNITRPINLDIDQFGDYTKLKLPNREGINNIPNYNIKPINIGKYTPKYNSTDPLFTTEDQSKFRVGAKYHTIRNPRQLARLQRRADRYDKSLTGDFSKNPIKGFVQEWRKRDMEMANLTPSSPSHPVITIPRTTVKLSGSGISNGLSFSAPKSIPTNPNTTPLLTVNTATTPVINKPEIKVNKTIDNNRIQFEPTKSNLIVADNNVNARKMLDSTRIGNSNALNFTPINGGYKSDLVRKRNKGSVKL